MGNEGTPWYYWPLSVAVLGGGPGFIVLLIFIYRAFTAPFERGASVASVMRELADLAKWWLIFVIWIAATLLALFVIGMVMVWMFGRY